MLKIKQNKFDKNLSIPCFHNDMELVLSFEGEEPVSVMEYTSRGHGYAIFSIKRNLNTNMTEIEWTNRFKRFTYQTPVNYTVEYREDGLDGW